MRGRNALSRSRGATRLPVAKSDAKGRAQDAGRPRAITPEMAARICDRISEGRTLRDVAGDGDLPHRDTIYAEMRRNADFAGAISRARAEGAHSLAEQVIEIADAATPSTAQVARNRCDQRRWLAGKFNAMYADKVALTAADGGNLRDMNAADRAAWALEVAARARRLLESPVIEGEAEEGKEKD